MLKVNEGRAGEEDRTMDDDGGAKSGKYFTSGLENRILSGASA